MDACGESQIKFMAEALLNHAREIHRYAKTYCLPSLVNEAVGEDCRAQFRRNADRMLREMYNLMRMARRRGISRHCNREQIEAFVLETEAVLAASAAFRQSAPILN